MWKRGVGSLILCGTREPGAKWLRELVFLPPASRFRPSQGALVVKIPPANVGDATDVGSIPGLRRSPGEGNGNPLQYSCLGNPMDRGAWWATVHGVAKSQTRLSKHAVTAREGSPRVARVEYFSPSYSLFYSAFSWLLPYRCITYLMGLQTI